MQAWNGVHEIYEMTQPLETIALDYEYESPLMSMLFHLGTCATFDN